MSWLERLRRGPSIEEALLAGGVEEEEIERAAAVGGLELLAIDRLLDEAPRTLSQRDIAEKSGLPVEDISQVWRGRFTGGERAEPEPSQGLVADITGDGADDLILQAHDRVLIYPQATAAQTAFPAQSARP